jgi:hypothetical protein
LGNDIVASEVNGVGAGDLEEDLLAFADDEVKGLLVVLEKRLD